jgi:UDP-N-acetylglucosamine transferase subunit ALG13
VYLIRKLLEKNFEVILGGYGPSLKFLKSEFPQLEDIRIPSHTFSYSKIFPAWFMIIVQIPAFLIGIFKEHRYLIKIVHQHHINLIISDARYGLWYRYIPSVILTHQVSIRMPFLFKAFKYPVNYLNRLALRKFSQLWIPDFPTNLNLSGVLSHNLRIPSNSFYIGSLSRFTDHKSVILRAEGFEVAVVLSGPEPQRSVLEKKVTAQLVQQSRKSIVIGGKIEEKISEDLAGSCRYVSFLSADPLYAILKSAKYIICRSGYSTIMDLIALGKTAFLVPTPGQTEQEYLAQYLEKQRLFLFSRQKDFNLKHAIRRLEEFKPADFPCASNAFTDEIMNRLNELLG